MVKFFTSIRQRILFAFLLMALAGVASSLWNVALLFRHEQHLERLQGESLPVLIAAYEMARQGESIAKGASGVVLTRDKWTRGAFVNRIIDQFNWLDRQLSTVAELRLDQDKIQRIETHKQALRVSFEDLARAIETQEAANAPSASATPEQSKALANEVERLLLLHKFHAERLTYSVADLAISVSGEIKGSIAVIRDGILKEVWLLALYACAATILAMMVVLYVDRNVGRRVVAIQKSMRAIADGDTREGIPRGGNDEISDMGAALSTFVTKLGEREEQLQELVDERTQKLATAHESLTLSERRLRNLFEVASDWFCELDADFHITDLSPKFAEILGDQCNIHGQTIFEFLDAPGILTDSTALEGHFQNLREHKPYRLFEFSVLSPDETVLHLQSSGIPLFDDEGRFAGYQNSITDVTEYKKAELERRHLQKMQALGNLAGGVAHSFNNIFQPIVILSELTRNEVGADTPIGERMQISIDASRRGKTLCDRILLYSRQDSPDMMPFDIRDLTQATLELFRATMPTSIHLNEALDGDVGKIVGDASQIEAMILNLASNAVAAIGTNPGEIQVKLAQVPSDQVEYDNGHDIIHGTYARLTVTDNGCGIDAKTRERIFDPFFTTKGLGKGTGLGLSMASGITIMHGGGIKVISAPGQGSTFHVYLPLDPSSA